MRYRRCKFGCDRSIIKGTLLGERSTFSFVSWVQFEGLFLKVHTSHSTSMRYTPCKFGRDRSAIMGPLLGARSTFSAVSRLPLEGFS
jgi:hypothetical protein